MRRMVVSPPIATRCSVLLRRLAAEHRASVALTFAVTAFPIFVAVGAAVDYSRASNIRTELQTAMDAAVLVGAADKSSGRNTTALNMFKSNVRRIDTALVTTTFTTLDSNVYTGTASVDVPTTLSTVASFASIAVAVKASALANAYPPCVMALNATTSGALTVAGSSGITSPECGVQVNSNST